MVSDYAALLRVYPPEPMSGTGWRIDTERAANRRRIAPLATLLLEEAVRKVQIAQPD